MSYEQSSEQSRLAPNRQSSGEAPLLTHLNKDWLDYYSDVDPENETDFFSLNQELFLSTQIQAGLLAQEALEAASSDTERTELQAIINTGTVARTALFEVNIPFALYFARESVGINHPGVEKKRRAIGFKGIYGSSAGTYSPLLSLKSPFASLEDRQQSALEGLWEATERYSPDKSAKFTTFAAWAVQSRIDNDITNEEHNGTRYPSNLHDKIRAYFKKFPYADTVPIPEDIKTLSERAAYIRFEDIKPHEHSLISIDDTSDEDYPETVADLYGSDMVDGELFEIVNEALGASLKEVLDTLSEREAGVIKMRFGIDLPEPATLDEIARTYGVTRERIRQIESKAMSKIREYSRAKYLKTYIYPGNEGAIGSSSPLSDERLVDSQYYGRAGDGSILGLGRIATVKASAHRFKPPSERPLTVEEYRKNEEKKAWQAFPGESWDEPVRTTHLHEAEPLKAIVDSYQFEQIKNTLLNSQSYHFQTSFGEAVNTPAPIALLKRIGSLTDGEYLIRSKVDSLYFDFIAETVPKLCAELGNDFSVSRTQSLFDTLYKKYVYDDIEDENLDLETQALLSELLVHEVNTLLDANLLQSK